MSFGKSSPGLALLPPTLNVYLYRLDTGIPGYNGARHMGCYPFWNGQDLWGVRENAAVDALYFSGQGMDRTLHIPSLRLEMYRL